MAFSETAVWFQFGAFKWREMNRSLKRIARLTFCGRGILERRTKTANFWKKLEVVAPRFAAPGPRSDRLGTPKKIKGTAAS